jgi:Ser/Thr protein kinase RdoA (MazF antagonist)
MAAGTASGAARGDRTTAALTAAAVVASRVGLSAVRPRLLVAGADVVVAMEPRPVVARVTSLHENHEGRIAPAVQVARARHAEHRGGPVVAPWSGGAGPFDTGEFIVTLWERVADQPVTPESVGHALRHLHAAIADFPGELPSFDPRPAARRIVADLPPSAHDTAAVLLAACDFCELPDLPGQPLHGDAHFGNALGSTAGPLWTDLEYACVGPIEWDLASAAHQATVLGRRVPETRALLTAYGVDAVDRANVMTDLVALHVAAQTAAAVAHRPDLRPLADQRLHWVRRRLG